jgi:putative ATP-binding cassette transporter
MSYLGEFGRRAPNQVFLSIVLGAIAGLAYAGLIPTLLLALSAPEPMTVADMANEPFYAFGLEIAHHQAAALFLTLCLIIWTSRTLSQILLLRVALVVSADLRQQLFQVVARSSIECLETVGLVRINTALTTDVGRIVVGARTIPDLLINSITVTGVLAFLFFVNSSVFIFILVAIFVGGITYRLPIYIASRYLLRVRKVYEQQGEATRALVQGAQELKINHAKREHFFRDVLSSNERLAVALEIRGTSLTKAAVSYGDLISISTVGIVAFIFVNYRTISQNELTGIVMGLLYLVGPIAAIMGAVPQIAVAKIAQQKLNELLRDMPAEVEDVPPKPVDEWQSIRFADVVYRHSSTESTRGFSVGPFDLELRRGEITMIVGGNGSGKSTIGKLISMHYLPAAGTVKFDDTIIGHELVSSYRQEVTAIFSNYYLFDHLFGLAGHDQVAIDAYLSILKLDEKVKIQNGAFSTINLSDGQRRRLALLTAFLEDRSLYVFDEWAADQDPEFKQFFYQHLLGDLRKANKAVVVITHDDRYFNVADQLVFIEDGKIVRKQKLSHALDLTVHPQPCCP